MVVGVGLDLAEVSRLEQAVARHGTRFLERVFTPAEQRVLTSAASSRRLAGRFAAKEAVMKALGTGWSCGVKWRDIEIVTEGGPPQVRLHGRAQETARERGIGAIHISLTHEGSFAAAVAVAETAAGPGVLSPCGL